VYAEVGSVAFFPSIYNNFLLDLILGRSGIRRVSSHAHKLKSQKSQNLLKACFSSLLGPGSLSTTNLPPLFQASKVGLDYSKDRTGDQAIPLYLARLADHVFTFVVQAYAR
jgi:hypothetical protein